jgi:hypothetical protein
VSWLQYPGIWLLFHGDTMLLNHFSTETMSELIQQRRQHALCDVPRELFHGSEVLATEPKAHNDDFFFLVHED